MPKGASAGARVQFQVSSDAIIDEIACEIAQGSPRLSGKERALSSYSGCVHPVCTCNDQHGSLLLRGLHLSLTPSLAISPGGIAAG